jgi:hypothetical protein
MEVSSASQISTALAASRCRQAAAPDQVRD